jgi:hypothetical protein
MGTLVRTEEVLHCENRELSCQESSAYGCIFSCAPHKTYRGQVPSKSAVSDRQQCACAATCGHSTNGYAANADNSFSAVGVTYRCLPALEERRSDRDADERQQGVALSSSMHVIFEKIAPLRTLQIENV